MFLAAKVNKEKADDDQRIDRKLMPTNPKTAKTRQNQRASGPNNNAKSLANPKTASKVNNKKANPDNVYGDPPTIAFISTHEFSTIPEYETLYFI